MRWPVEAMARIAVSTCVPKCPAAGVAVEHGRKHAQRERRRHEERERARAASTHLAELHGNGAALRQLEVFLYALRLIAGGDLAVDPFSRVERGARLGELGRNVRTSGMVISMAFFVGLFEPEVDADQRVGACSGNEVAGMRQIDVDSG